MQWCKSALNELNKIDRKLWTSSACPELRGRLLIPTSWQQASPVNLFWRLFIYAYLFHIPECCFELLALLHLLHTSPRRTSHGPAILRDAYPSTVWNSIANGSDLNSGKVTNQRRHWCLKLIMLFWSWLIALQQWLYFILHQERAGLHNCEQKRMQPYPLTCMVTGRYVSCMIYGCSPFYDYLAVILPLIEYTINYYSQVNMCSSTSQWQYGQVTLDARAPL